MYKVMRPSRVRSGACVAVIIGKSRIPNPNSQERQSGHDRTIRTRAIRTIQTTRTVRTKRGDHSPARWSGQASWTLLLYDSRSLANPFPSGRVVRSHRIADSVHVSGLSADAIGGKALALTRLERAGMPVPSWFCVTTAVFHDVTASLSDLVANDLAQLDPADAERAAAISRTVMHAIHDRGLSAQDRAAIAALL